jgi:C_GCAxxG_C_C family probable redox protein
MYNKEAHEKAFETIIKSLPLRMVVRLGGRPYEPELDKPVFVGVWCSEKVIEALQPLCPLKWNRLADVTIGIGAGFAHMGEVCGVLSAGIIAIGLDLASRYRDTVPLRYQIMKFSQKLMRDFAKEFGAIRCRDLIDEDISGLIMPGDEGYKAHVLRIQKMVDDGVAIEERLCHRILRWVIMYPLPSEQEELPPPVYV